MLKDLNKIKALARKKEKENQDFRIFLKGCNHYQVDKIVHELYQKYLSQYDCKECGNCCTKLTPTLTQKEIKKIAKVLNISLDTFKENYIERKMPEGFILKGWKCPFLSNNKCSIYEYRPEVCRSYPHLHKDNINHRLLNLIDNTFICPIVYNIFEDLKEKLWDKENII